MDARRSRYLQAMGITQWLARTSTDPAEPIPAHAPAGESGGADAGVPTQTPAEGLDWDALRDTVLACTRCPLHESRTQAVFGVGAQDADWMIIGEAPGAEEDRQGEPFVGRAGQLLDAMLAGVGLSRETAYIANVLKCRPPNNRDPKPEEAVRCAPFLDRQIALISPRIILAVGRVAAQRLLDTDTPVGRMRGRLHRHAASQVPVVVTYHPAYLLRRPGEKAKVWRDLLFAAAVASDQAG
jgi:DNA polymerase